MTDPGTIIMILFFPLATAIVISVVVIDHQKRKKEKTRFEKYWADYQALFDWYTSEKNRLTKGCKQYVIVDSTPNAVARFPQGHLSTGVRVSDPKRDQILVFEDYPPIAPQTNFKGEAFPATGGSIRVVSGFPVSDVLYWAEKGTVQYTSNISGGGSNLAGALVGGAIAGDVGAIIGSRDSVRTETIRHDTRRIVIKMQNAAEYEYPFSFYNAFIQCMPEKEYEYLKMSNKQN